MPSLQDLIMQDVLGTSTKTASAPSAVVPSAGLSDDMFSKVAMELGLFADSETATPAVKTAGSTTSEAVAAAEAARGTSSVADKVAAAGGNFTDLYSSVFPDDALGGADSEKVASAEKVAAEEALGARTWDHFAARFDARIEKIAYEALSGSAHKGDVEPPNHIPNDKHQRDAGGGAIDTTPQIRDEIKNVSPEGGVGKYTQEHADKVASAAFRKHMLLAQLDA